MDLGAVLLADVVQSRKQARFRELRDERLHEVSRKQLSAGLIRYPYAVTAGDEFQTVLCGPAGLAEAAFDLRCAFRPMRLWIGVGIGALATLPTADEPVNVGGTGEAFEMARDALAALKHEQAGKYETLTRLRSTSSSFSLALNLVLCLQDILMADITAAQWRTIAAYRSSGVQHEAATQLGVSASTVSRNLHRARYQHLADSIATLGDLIRSWPLSRGEGGSQH